MRHKLLRQYRDLCAQRGSALLISLMVMVGLSMLGLGFVALSETEAAISTNQRNREEVLTHAEAAAAVVVDWFQAPVWAVTSRIGPANDTVNNPELNAMKLTRRNTTMSGKYKPYLGSYLFDLPFKPAAEDRFFGTADYPDILINKTTAPTFLARFNQLVFSDTADAGQVTEIRLWAPPVSNGSINGTTHYYEDGGDRYGIATLRVTAQKLDAANNVIAQRVVQLVVTEFPFPGPNGPIESNSAITTNGSFTVYWGQISSQKQLTLKQKDTLPGLPWATAWDQVEYEHGYNSSTEWKPGGVVYQMGDVVHASLNARTANPDLEDWSFVCTTATCKTGPTSNQEPNWSASNPWGTTYNEGGSGSGTWKQRSSTMWPLFDKDTTANTDKYNWLWQTIGWKFADPWAETRTRADMVNAPNANPEPYGIFSNPAADPSPISAGAYTTFYNWFQFQTTDTPPYRKIVPFPRIDYDFWKQIALAGDGQPGVYYFHHDDAANNGTFYRLSDSTNSKAFEDWVNSCTGVTGALGPGFYFFDTRGSKDPQVAGANRAAILTETVGITSKYAKPCFTMKGFIYSNAAEFGSTGVRGDNTKLYNYPGEPFRDVGFYEVDTATGKLARNALGRLNSPINARNRHWDHQELNNNNTFDLVLTDITRDAGGNPTGAKKADGTVFPTPTYVPVEWYEGCTVPDTVAGTAGNCSEPHEPYLNLIYPRNVSVAYTALPTDLGTSDITRANAVYCKIGWEAAGAQTRLAKEATTTAMTTPANCGTNPEKCTSNNHDDVGPLTNLGGPILEGVLYVEGAYNSHGNATYYGSILVQGDCCGTGTPQVYFDQSLLTQDFKKKFPNFPRVYISSYSTE